MELPVVAKILEKKFLRKQYRPWSDCSSGAVWWEFAVFQLNQQLLSLKNKINLFGFIVIVNL